MIKMIVKYITLIYTAQVNENMLATEVRLMMNQISYVTNAVKIANYKNQFIDLNSNTQTSICALFGDTYKEMIDDAEESKEEYLEHVYGFTIKDKRLYKDLLKNDFLFELFAEFTEYRDQLKTKKEKIFTKLTTYVQLESNEYKEIKEKYDFVEGQVLNFYNHLNIKYAQLRTDILASTAVDD